MTQEPGEEAALEDDGAPTEAADAQERYVLTPEDRRRYLGKLAEFELQLTALPELQANFVLAILQDPTNYKEAARRAGYKASACHIMATRLLNKPKVAACIALGEQLRADRTMHTVDRTLHEFGILAYSDIRMFTVNQDNGQVTTVPGVPEYMTRAISAIEWDVHTWSEGDVTHTRVKTKVKLWNKNDALKMLAIYQRMMQPDTNVTDNSKHLHLHNHQAPGSNMTWQFGDQMIPL